jgi:hypothetical protein
LGVSLWTNNGESWQSGQQGSKEGQWVHWYETTKLEIFAWMGKVNLGLKKIGKWFLKTF